MSALAKLTNSLAGVKENFTPETGAVQGGFLTFNGKDGDWSFGQTEEDAEGWEAVVNVANLQHGWMRWGTNPPAKAYTTIDEPLPMAPEPVTDEYGKVREAQKARCLQGMFMDGTGSGEAFQFEIASMGGVENVDKLITAVIARASAGEALLYPVVRLNSEWYKSQHGKIYKPVFEIIDWTDEMGELSAATPAIEEAEDEEESPPRLVKRKRRLK